MARTKRLKGHTTTPPHTHTFCYQNVEIVDPKKLELPWESRAGKGKG